MLSGFDADGYYGTPLRTVLEKCKIDHHFKDGLRWILFDETPSGQLRDAANRILYRDGDKSQPAYKLEPGDREIRYNFERVLKGALIKPELIFARYISPQEIGVRKDLIDAKSAEYDSLKLRYQQSESDLS